MLYGRYRFKCRFEIDARLPSYKGSTFRGVFGHALKAVVCALKRQVCETCLLKSQCIYARVFETHLAPPPAGSRNTTAPHPFVIQPPLTAKTRYSRGDPFSFSLLLFGEVNHHLPYFIYAFDRMGQLGVGKKINGRRGRFVLETVEHQGTPIYSHTDQRLVWDQKLPEIKVALLPERSNENTQLQVTLKTPLRLKFENQLSADLPFHLLVRAMLRRISSLMIAYDAAEPHLDYKGLVQRANDVKMIDSNLHWFDWKRYSARQDRKILMGGMVGEVTYAGALGEFLSLVEF